MGSHHGLEDFLEIVLVIRSIQAFVIQKKCHSPHRKNGKVKLFQSKEGKSIPVRRIAVEVPVRRITVEVPVGWITVKVPVRRIAIASAFNQLLLCFGQRLKISVLSQIFECKHDWRVKKLRKYNISIIQLAGHVMPGRQHIGFIKVLFLV